MDYPVDPAPVPGGRLPGLGHVIPLALRPLDFLQSLRPLGEVVKIYIGPRPVYVVNSPEMIHRLMVADAAKFRKGIMFDRARGLLGDGLLTSEGRSHLQERRLVQQAFHHDRIDRFTGMFSAEAARRTSRWEAGAAVSLRREMSDLALDTLMATLFAGADFRPVDAAVFHRAMPALQKGSMARMLYPFESMCRLPIPVNRRFDEAVAGIHRIIEHVIENSRAGQGGPDSLLSMLIAARDPDTGAGITDRQLRDELVTFLLAGAETVATTLSWLFHELGRHPAVERRVHEEIDTVLSGDPVDCENIKELAYLRRVLSETLRMHTPNWIVMRRTTTAAELGSVRLPPGTELLFSLTTLHRDPQLYPNPRTFDPDRWLSTGHTKDLPRTAFIPFGQGNRKCIGDSFAWNELTAVAATIATRWRLSSPPDQKVREALGATVWPQPLRMIAIPRT